MYVFFHSMAVTFHVVHIWTTPLYSITMWVRFWIFIRIFITQQPFNLCFKKQTPHLTLSLIMFMTIYFAFFPLAKNMKLSLFQFYCWMHAKWTINIMLNTSYWVAKFSCKFKIVTKITLLVNCVIFNCGSLLGNILVIFMH